MTAAGESRCEKTSGRWAKHARPPSPTREENRLVLALPRAGKGDCLGEGREPLLEQNVVLIKELKLAGPCRSLGYDEHASITLTRPECNGTHCQASREQRLYRTSYRAKQGRK